MVAGVARPRKSSQPCEGLLASMLVASSLVLLGGCGGGSDAAPEVAATPTIPFEILWTNDTHGYFVPTYHAEYTEIDSYATTAATEGTIGGYARIAAMVKNYKAKNPDTVFVDGGDTFDGSPVAQLTQGAAVIPILNAMGYDVMVPGNRDFAFNKESFLAVTKGGTTTGTIANGVTAPGITSPGIKFPIVAANLLDADTKLPVFPRYYIKQTPHLKIAFIGLTSPLAGGTRKADGSQGFLVEGQTAQTATAPAGANVPAGFRIEDEISSLAATIRQVDNPDLVVVLSHLGYYQDRKFAARSTNIDVIVGAHTHHNVTNPPAIPNADGSRKVVVTQAGSHGKYLGKLDLQVKDKKVVSYTNELVRVTAANAPTPDPAVQALADAAYAPFKAQLDTVVGQTTTVIERRGDVQSTMGVFLADAIASIFGTDTSSSPGIRYGSSIPGSAAKPAPITYGDVINMVSPNIGSNAMYVGTTTGTAILSALNNGLNNEYGEDIYTWGGGDVTRYNGRVKYTYNITAPVNKHIVDLTVTDAAGVAWPLVEKGVSNAANLAKVFTFAGSSGTAAQMVTSPLTAVDQIVAYIKSQPNSTVGPKIDDRAVCLDKAKQATAEFQAGFYQCPGPSGA
ncbi:MAG: bifunctional UDP-sugar hydrolase/5'-nucleotidase [Sterolibacterium sp.]